MAWWDWNNYKQFTHTVTLLWWKFLLKAHVSRLKVCMRKIHVCHRALRTHLWWLCSGWWVAGLNCFFSPHLCLTLTNPSQAKWYRKREVTRFPVINAQMWSHQEAAWGHLSPSNLMAGCDGLFPMGLARVWGEGKLRQKRSEVWGEKRARWAPNVTWIKRTLIDHLVTLDRSVVAVWTDLKYVISAF